MSIVVKDTFFLFLSSFPEVPHLLTFPSLTICVAVHAPILCRDTPCRLDLGTLSVTLASVPASSVTLSVTLSFVVLCPPPPLLPDADEADLALILDVLIHLGTNSSGNRM